MTVFKSAVSPLLDPLGERKEENRLAREQEKGLLKSRQTVVKNVRETMDSGEPPPSSGVFRQPLPFKVLSL